MSTGMAMTFAAKATDRLVFGTLYVLVAALTLWAGFGLINRGLEMRLLKDNLLHWEVCLTEFGTQQGQWPVFSGDNHAAYMDRLTIEMTRLGIHPPASNTAVAYRYRIGNFGRADEDLFLLCLHDRMVIFGLSSQSMQRLDRMVDRHADLKNGRISGLPAKTAGTFIGQWRL